MFGIALKDADVHTRLSTYLNDHLGGSSGGIELARRLYGNNKDNNDYGPKLGRIAKQIEEDIASLRDDHDPPRRRGGPHQAGRGMGVRKGRAA